jgi:hypothetical protein
MNSRDPTLLLIGEETASLYARRSIGHCGSRCRIPLSWCSNPTSTTPWTAATSISAARVRALARSTRSGLDVARRPRRSGPVKEGYRLSRALQRRRFAGRVCRRSAACRGGEARAHHALRRPVVPHPLMRLPQRLRCRQPRPGPPWRLLALQTFRRRDPPRRSSRASARRAPGGT